MPYRLATPQDNLSVGVSKGFRTHDLQSHNLALYQLSYTHHKCGLVRLEGFEPPTFALEGHCSIQLSYKRKYSIFNEVRPHAQLRCPQGHCAINEVKGSKN